ncbi:MAG TPA: insulinase family protein [Parasegetibacter sp.]
MRIKFLLAGLMLMVSFSMAQVKSDLSKPLPIDTSVRIGKLSNGLTYYIRKNSMPAKRAELYLVNKVGSILEDEDQLGLAHFVEHMAFNGSRDFPKNELINYLQKNGVKFGADINAYTAFDETVYQLPIPTDSIKVFERGFDILLNWAGYLSFDHDEIDAERGVILEEARLRGKNAQERMQNQILPVLLNNSRYAERLPIGKEDVLKTFTYDVIKRYYKDWYRPDLQAVIAVGDFDPDQVEKWIKEKFSELKMPSNPKPRPRYDIPEQKGTVTKIVTDNEFPYTVAQVIYRKPIEALVTGADLKREITVQLFNNLINNRIQELLQKKDAPFVYGNSAVEEVLGVMKTLTAVTVAKPGELEASISAVLGELQRAAKFGFTATELERAKKAMMAQMESAYKERDKTNSANYVSVYQSHFLKGSPILNIGYAYEFYKTHLGDISVDEVNSVVKNYISDDNRVVLLQAPSKDSATLPSEQQLLTWVANAGKDLVAYEDNVSDEPLLANLPAGSKVIKSKQIPEIGATEWKLANGITVVLKPTTYKNDQILFNGSSFGGTSLASDKDFYSAVMASQVVPAGGVGNFSQIQLSKMLAGKKLSVSPFINELYEGIGGSASPEDLETALQVVYLFFTSPRKDEEVFESLMTQFKVSLENRGLEPENVFEDTITAVLGNYHIRRMKMPKERIDEIDLDKALAFFKDRFADASDFKFTFVGAIDTAKLKPLIERYIGGLPSINRKETYRNLKIYPPTGRITKTVYKGEEEKSFVQMVYTGTYDFSEEENMRMTALKEILQIKLVERLREKEGGVYSPGIEISYSRIPEGRFSASIYFGCAPDNVENLVAAVEDEIKKLQQEGATADDLQKFKAEQKRATEVSMLKNDFWLSYISNRIVNGRDLNSINGYDARLNAVTSEDVKKVAIKYLSGKNLAVFALKPEKK